MIAGLSSPSIALVSATAATFASTGVKFEFCVPYKLELVRVGVVLNAAPADAGVVLVKQRPIHGSAAGEVTLATLNLLTTHAAGAVVYKDLATHVSLKEGDSLTFEVTDASAGVTAAGAFAITREIPEVAGNNSEMIATT